MGCWDSYCCFCSGPFNSPREMWRWLVLEDLKDPKNPLGQNTTVSKEELVDQIVHLTEEDDAIWSDSILIGPYWPSFVSPPCTVQEYGNAEVDNEDGDGYTFYAFNDGDNVALVIHRTCLSLLCRRLNTTPQQLWSCFGDESRYRQDKEIWDGLLWDVKYYGISGRAEQMFEFSDRSDRSSWVAEEDWEDCNWLLAAPTVFPSLVPNRSRAFNASLSQSQLANCCHLALLEPDLLSTILDWVVPFKIQVDLEEEMVGGQNDDPHSLVRSLRDLLSMMQVNNRWYRLITQHRQDLFFRLAWQFGWMLPACPEDWKSWNAINPPLPLLFETATAGMREGSPATPVNDYDWRVYLSAYVRKEDRHIRNRYRLHRMCVQFARGREYEDWSWSIGKLGVAPMAHCPVLYDWEERVEKKKKIDYVDDE